MFQSNVRKGVGSVRFRLATERDLPAIVGMLVDDSLGAQREHLSDPVLPCYLEAFNAIAKDPNNELVVAENRDGEAIATLQLTFTPGLSHQGRWRATIESVRVASPLRGSGIGRQLLAWAIARAKQRQCPIVQLTTDKQRLDTKRFYESMGFSATHEGMKLKLHSDRESI